MLRARVSHPSDGPPASVSAERQFEPRCARKAGGLRNRELAARLLRCGNPAGAMDEFSSFRNAPDSGHDSVGAFLLADCAHRYARRKSHRDYLLDRLLHPRFSADPRLDPVARSELRFPEYADEESALCTCAAFQSL